MLEDRHLLAPEIIVVKIILLMSCDFTRLVQNFHTTAPKAALSHPNESGLLIGALVLLLSAVHTDHLWRVTCFGKENRKAAELSLRLQKINQRRTPLAELSSNTFLAVRLPGLPPRLPPLAHLLLVIGVRGSSPR